MLLGQFNSIHIDRYIMILKNIHSKVSNVTISEGVTTTILAIKHHKKYKVLVKIIFEDDKFIEVGKDTILQIAEDDLARLTPAKDLIPGSIICPPIPHYADVRLWAETYGLRIKARQLVLAKASTVIFDKCEYVTIGDVPLLHDNQEYNKLRKVARRSTSLANLLMK